MALFRAEGDPAWTIGLSRAQRDALALELDAIERDRSLATAFFVLGLGLGAAIALGITGFAFLGSALVIHPARLYFQLSPAGVGLAVGGGFSRADR